MQKVTFFAKNCRKYQFNYASFCVQGQPRLEIRNRNHPRTRFNATNLMQVSDLANELSLEIMFLDISSIVSIYMNLINLITRALFWKLSIPLDSCWRVGLNYELKPLFWLTVENFTFWMILPLGSETWNRSLEAVVNAHRAFLGSYKR